MSEFDQESLSALLDDEADELALPRLLRLYEEYPEIAEKWRLKLAPGKCFILCPLILEALINEQ